MIKYETERYIVSHNNGKLIGQEKDHNILKKDDVVLIQKLKKGKELLKSVSDAFDKIEAESKINKGDIVAIKVNIGGGIDYTLHPDSSWPDQDMLEQIKEHVMDYGEVNFWKPILYLQYFLPHYLQIKMFLQMEFFFT